MFMLLVKLYLVLGFAWALVYVYELLRDCRSHVAGRDVEVRGTDHMDATELKEDLLDYGRILSGADRTVTNPKTIIVGVFTLNALYTGLSWPFRVWDYVHADNVLIVPGYKKS